ncbi:hypothetical protein A2W24_01550 [Microgenomates group bacterium RBG_16_45_19]|nr:MAG: hypothetical protein A2W24_01550 [Microgenomates group bacterium RBG_16_45_19]
MRILLRIRGLSQPTIRWGLGLGLVLIGCQGLVLVVWGLKLPPEIPLYYSMPQGEQQLAEKGWLLISLGLSLLALVTNLVIIGLSGQLVKVFPEIVTWLTTVCILLLTLTLVHSVMLAL